MDFQSILEGYAPLVGIILLTILWLFIFAIASFAGYTLFLATAEARKRFIVADSNPAVLAFGQSDLGKFVNAQLGNLTQSVDEPTDAIIVKISDGINQLAKRKVISPEQASRYLLGFLTALRELTDGEVANTDELNDLFPEPPAS